MSDSSRDPRSVTSTAATVPADSPSGNESLASTGIVPTVSRFAFSVTGLSVAAVLIATLVLVLLSNDQTGSRLTDFREAFQSSEVEEHSSQIYQPDVYVITEEEHSADSAIPQGEDVGESSPSSDVDGNEESDETINVPRESFLGLVNELGREGLPQVESSRIIVSEYHIPLDAATQSFPVELLASEIVTITNQHFDRDETSLKPVKRIVCTVWSATTAADSMETALDRSETLREELSDNDFHVVAAVWGKSDVLRPVMTVRIEQ